MWSPLPTWEPDNWVTFCCHENITSLDISLSFYWLNPTKKKISKLSKLKIWKWNDFGGFQLPEVRGKNSKKFQISIFGFQCVANDREGWLKFCTSYMVYSHIWLNLPKSDCHFFHIFLLMIATLAKNKNPQKKHWLTCKLNLLVTKSALGCNIWRKEKVLGYRTTLMWPVLSFGMRSYFILSNHCQSNIWTCLWIQSLPKPQGVHME
jgi:hypothetical protein